MRIIAGALRGRKLASPPGRGTRPMLAKVREALFSTLGPGIEGAWVLDLFAGSGSLGLEAASRGAAFVRLVEADRRAFATLAENVEGLDLAASVEAVRGDSLDPNTAAPPPGEPPRWADLVLFDPPYPWLRDERRGRLLERIAALVAETLRPEGLLVFHAPARELREEELDAIWEPRSRRYGSSALWYLRAPAESDEPEVA